MKTRYVVVTSTFLLSVLLYVDRTCISTAQEPVMKALALTDRQWGVVMSAFAFGYALFQAPGGIMADRMGARKTLAAVVAFWSLFTGLTATAWSFLSLVAIRFLFGAGEAGAFPGMARVAYAWIPLNERGLVKGINFSGSRLGAAITMPILPWMITRLGWKESFLALMVLGLAWSLFWWRWFRDEPLDHRSIRPAERDYILSHRQSSGAMENATRLGLGDLLASGTLWLLMAQYFASNFTFFFTLTWLYPFVKKTYQLQAVHAGFMAMVPLLAGAAGNLLAGWLVDRLFRSELKRFSRRLPALIGFSLAAIGLLQSVSQNSALGAVLWLSLAIFGADMTLSPSWSTCIDIGGASSGAVSGTMNMAGNLGSALVGLAFPFLVERFGPGGFFYTGACLNVLAVMIWLVMLPRKIGEPHL